MGLGWHGEHHRDQPCDEPNTSEPLRPGSRTSSPHRRPLHGLSRVLRAAGRQLHDLDRPVHQRRPRLRVHVPLAAGEREAYARGGRLRPAGRHLPHRAVRRVQGNSRRDPAALSRPDRAHPGGPGSHGRQGAHRSGLRGGRRSGHLGCLRPDGRDGGAHLLRGPRLLPDRHRAVHGALPGQRRRRKRSRSAMG